MPLNPSKFESVGNLLREGGKQFGSGTVGALLAILAGLAFFYLRFGLGLVHLSYDLPFAIRPVVHPQEAVMVYLDDDSHRELNQPYNAPWDRSLHARLLNRLTAEGARAVVFDIVFSDAGPSAPADAALVNALRSNKTAILAADDVPSGYGLDGVAAKEIIPPYDPFADAAAAIGSDEMNPDDDLIQRRHQPVSGDDQIPSLSWAAAKIAGAKITAEDSNSLAPRWINYYGPATTIPNVSFYQAIATNSDLAPAGYFSNKVVFVGARLFTKFSGERKDEYPTPHSRWARKYPFMPGVEIQATQCLNLMRGDWLNRLPLNVEAALIIFAGAVAGFGFVRFRPVAATGLALLGAGLIVSLAYELFLRERIWFAWLIPVVVQIPIALAWAIIYNSITSYIQNRLLEQSLGLYLSPKQVQRILKEPGLRKPGGSKQVVSILFSDIAGFSRISEQLDPQDLVLLLNSYYETTIRAIHQTEGTVMDIIGDAIFAVWNAPEPQRDHREKMLQAAQLFQLNVKEFNGKQGSIPLHTRVGLHTGEVVVGNVGSSEHFDYTAVGENVNLASRLEGLNKQLGTDVLMTRAAIPPGDGPWRLRPVGKFRFKGFDNVVEVVEFLVLTETRESARAWIDAFGAALVLFQGGNFRAAESGFRRALELRPGDGPSTFYLEKLKQQTLHTPLETWSGEINLEEK